MDNVLLDASPFEHASDSHVNGYAVKESTVSRTFSQRQAETVTASITSVHQARLSQGCDITLHAASCDESISAYSHS